MDAVHLQLKHPFTCLVSGPTGSGKTVFVRRLLKHYRQLTTIDVAQLQVVYVHGQAQALFSQAIAPNVTVQYVYVRDVEDFLAIEARLLAKTPHLVIIDDLMNELGGNAALANLFTKRSHHMGFSVIFIMQNIFHKGKEVRNLSLNSHYIVLFKNARDKSQIDALARQMYPENVVGFRDVFRDATLRPYTYLLIDCAPSTPDDLRLRARITPEEAIKGEHGTMIYKLEKRLRR